MATTSNNAPPVQKPKRQRPANSEEKHSKLHESDEEMFAQLDSTVFKRFYYYATPYKKAMLVATLAVIGFTLANLSLPLLVKFGIDSAIGKGDFDLLTLIAVSIIGVAGFYWVTHFLQNVLITRVALTVLYDIRADMFLQLQRLALSFSDKTPIGALMARMFGDVGALQEMLESSIEIIGDILTLVGIIVILLVLDFQLAIVTLAIVPALFLIRIVWQPFARRAFLRMRRNSSVVGVYLDQNVSGIRVVQALNRQKENTGIMTGKVRTFFWSAVRASRLGGVLMPTVELMTGTALAIVLIVGGGRVLSESIEIGTMVAFLLYVQRFFEPIRTLTMHYALLQRAVASGHRIFELLDIPLEIADKPGAEPIGEVEGRIEFKNVTFGYDPERPILRNISFIAEPGQTIALVGPTGSGKTSITALAHRFYDVQDGSITIDEQDIRDVTQTSIGGVMGMVLQEPFLFSKSVLENVSYNTHNATREDVVAACKIIGAHDFVMQLENGYDTTLEQRGSNLSVGQRQLLSFARALVADPKILVLDEATANIDSYTERIIQDALKKLLAGRTALVIAHRLSTIRNSDQIIVVRDGEIVETGTHDQLVESTGLYSQLWQTNYTSFDDIADNADNITGIPATST
ncbi:MAG: ABC transporter ATP-binding protein [Dehalococcoidia bacterium]|jgi:ATP-binding cassette subfamily B protein|nr:multidrug ABC transporter [Chloroflexota bacterium]MDP6056545.1 ABC transporter ATP-binding protein [Dehalococcoidia bacterium]MDP7090238.1 ABC transporter ATP-binding protein [Dehalococcoidia bacterium]MDP7262010.1 ABC transporter ATP-binding protein [Dehalococcoidia bacterium]MDP7485791.1 ABC transporter ATP-binding protein [Dehalococcoidia bacterium]|tara:strand:+ start:3381 stop:5279 length:1899 start_codon:yes stop_codon:yes gene_type:complete